MILCTHWHDDHIKGMSQLLEECHSANLYFSRATDMRKFLVWLGFDYQKLSEKNTIRSTGEFVKCLKIVRDRNLQPVRINADRLLKSIPALGVSIYSLSPSDYAIEQYDHEIGELITGYGNPGRTYELLSPNDKSVVILLEFGAHRAILGADLEVSDDNRKGWLNILDYSTVIGDRKASLFKISHHGSENGYHERIWTDLLETEPVSKLTPWNLGNNLPDLQMLRLYGDKTNQLYITSPTMNDSKPIKRDKKIDSIVEKFGIKLSEVKYNFGLVRSRVDFSNNLSKWSVELDGASLKI